MARHATVSVGDKSAMYATLSELALSKWTASKLRVLDLKDINILITSRLGDQELKDLLNHKRNMGLDKDGYIDEVINRIKKSVLKSSTLSSSSSPKRKGVSASASTSTRDANAPVASSSGNSNSKRVSDQGGSVDGRKTSQGVLKVTQRPRIDLPSRLLEGMEDQYPHLFPKPTDDERMDEGQAVRRQPRPVMVLSSFWSGEPKKPRPSPATTLSTPGETLPATDSTQPFDTVSESSADMNMDISVDDSGDDSAATMVEVKVDDKDERMDFSP